jgi:hypothetical protein
VLVTSPDPLSLCVPAQSLRAFMSSIMRWRNGLTVGVLMETPVLDEVDDTSILKTGHPATLSMISTLVNVLAERPLQRAIAQRFSGMALSVGSLRRRNTSGVGGKPDSSRRAWKRRE